MQNRGLTWDFPVCLLLTPLKYYCSVSQSINATWGLWKTSLTLALACSLSLLVLLKGNNPWEWCIMERMQLGMLISVERERDFPSPLSTCYSCLCSQRHHWRAQQESKKRKKYSGKCCCINLFMIPFQYTSTSFPFPTGVPKIFLHAGSSLSCQLYPSVQFLYAYSNSPECVNPSSFANNCLPL